MKTVKLLFIFLIVSGFISASASTASAGDNIKWYSYEEGLALVKAKNKKMYINFHADWCGYCHKMKKKTFADPKVISFLNTNYIPVRVNSDKEKKISSQFGIRGLPANWFLDEKGEKIGNQPGYLGPKDFLDILKFVNENKYKSKKK